VGDSQSIEVNWCRLGEEPTSEPFVFWHYDDALKFLKEEFEYMAYASTKPSVAPTQRSNLMKLRDAITYIQLRRGKQPLPEVEDCSFTIGDICYWLKGV